ncbi:MAG TPA: hypothetical protein VGG35_20665 [Streptosporangiaceae bacterium]|jgi:DNA-binding PadR family transcriptional regulator
MPDPDEPTLSLSEWVVLGLVCEQPAHGFAIAGLLGRQGSPGEVWRVARPVVYRAIQRLEALFPARGGSGFWLGSEGH